MFQRCMTAVTWLVLLGFVAPVPAIDTGDLPTTTQLTYENHSMLRVPPLSQEMETAFRRGHFDVARVEPDGSMMVVATARDRETLVAEFGARVEVDNLEEYYRLNLDPNKAMGGFHTYSETYDELVATMGAHPSLTRLDTIGYSLEGRAIYAFKISDNPDVDETDEPEVMINGLVHAREPMGVEICLTTIHHLLDSLSDPAIAELVNTTEIWFVPIINVDGYVYNEMTNPYGGGMWRKNRRDNGDGTWGIDLNRNWGFFWGDDGSSSPDGYSEIYRGTGPFSEPETQVMRDFINAHDFVTVLNIHSFGNYFCYPFGLPGVAGSPDNNIFGMLDNYLTGLTGYVGVYYDPVVGFSGDAACWQYGEQTSKRKAFSTLVEVGTEFWPTMEEKEDHCQRMLQACMYLIEMSHELFEHPSRWLRTPFTNVNSTETDCSEPYTWTAVFTYDADHAPITVTTTFNNFSSIPGWCVPTLFSGTVEPGGSFSVDFDFDPQVLFGHPNGTTTRGELSMVLMDPSSRLTLDILNFQVLLRYQADYNDGDSLLACADNCPFTPNDDQADIDGDDVGDVCDNCLDTPNSDQADADDDGAGDLCDICPGHDDFVDSDGDGLPDGCDNCPEVSNADQDDDDFDGVGTACDVCPGFDDLADADGDGAPDSCDACPGFDDFADYDEDGVSDSCDNCPDVFNPDQIDQDGNDIGDACQVMCGDANEDRLVNIADAVFLINYVFKGGPPPSILCGGDANGDGAVNVGDSVFIVNFVFKNGAAPVEVCCP